MSEGDWLLVGLEAKTARRQGVPSKIPVPKGEFESMADVGLKPDRLKKWISGFLAAAPAAWRNGNPDLARSFDRYLGKVDLWAKAQAAFGKEDFKAAVSTLKTICNLDPDDDAARMNLGATLASMGEHAAALDVLNKVRETFEGEADYHSTMGQLHAAMGKRDEAVDELVLTLEAQPDHQAALELLKQLGVLVAIYEDPKDASSLTYVRADAIGEYLTSVWDQSERDTAYFLDQAAYHASAGRHAVALAAAERAAAASEALHVHAEAAKIEALRELGRIDDAIEAARAFVAHDPRSALARVELAHALRAKGEAALAKTEVDQALELEPGNLRALDLAFWPAGKAREDISEIQKCIPALQAFAASHESAAGAWRSLARAKMLVTSQDEAFALYQKAVALAPDDDDLRAEVWTELGKQARYDVILADAANVSDMPKRDWRLRWNEAEALARTGKKTEARAAFAQIQMDSSLHVDLRKRAKRAAASVNG